LERGQTLQDFFGLIKQLEYPDLSNALLLGKTFSQKAIYDVANQKEMEVV